MLLILLPGVRLEDDCALAVVANIDSVSRLNPITESKTTRMPLYSFSGASVILQLYYHLAASSSRELKWSLIFRAFHKSRTVAFGYAL